MDARGTHHYLLNPVFAFIALALIPIQKLVDKFDGFDIPPLPIPTIIRNLPRTIDPPPAVREDSPFTDIFDDLFSTSLDVSPLATAFSTTFRIPRCTPSHRTLVDLSILLRTIIFWATISLLFNTWKKLRRRNKKIAELQHLHESAVAETEALRVTIRAKETDMAKMGREESYGREQRKKLAGDLQTLRKANADDVQALQTSLKIAQDEVQRVTQEAGDLRKTLTDEKQALETQVYVANQKIKDMDTEIWESRQQQGDLQKALNSRGEEVEKLKATASNMQQRAKKLDENLNAAERKAAALEQLLKTTKESRDAETTARERLELIVQEKDEEIRELRAALAALETSRAAPSKGPDGGNDNGGKSDDQGDKKGPGDDPGADAGGSGDSDDDDNDSGPGPGGPPRVTSSDKGKGRETVDDDGIGSVAEGREYDRGEGSEGVEGGERDEGLASSAGDGHGEGDNGKGSWKKTRRGRTPAFERRRRRKEKKEAMEAMALESEAGPSSQQVTLPRIDE